MWEGVRKKEREGECGSVGRSERENEGVRKKEREGESEKEREEKL